MAIAYSVKGNIEALPLDSFGFANVTHQTFKFAGNDAHPDIPVVDSEYIFRRDLFRRVLAFLETPEDSALWLYGPAGTGKTTIIRQFAARMMWPLYEITLNSRRELEDLIGNFEPQPGGGLKYKPGLVAQAMKEGAIVLVNEISIMEPGELAGLNEMMDGVKLKNGERIFKHPNFRFVATDNTNGRGDAFGMFQGTGPMNAAFVDRFEFIKVDRMSEDEEVTALVNVGSKAAEAYGLSKAMTPELLQSNAANMVKVANAVRASYKATMEGSNQDAGIGVDFTFRTLKRWMQKTLRFSMAQKPLTYALQVSFIDKLEESESMAVNAICRDVFGDLWGDANA